MGTDAFCGSFQFSYMTLIFYKFSAWFTWAVIGVPLTTLYLERFRLATRFMSLDNFPQN